MNYIDNEELLQLKFVNGYLMLPWFYTSIMYKKNNQQFSGESSVPVSFVRRILNLFKHLGKFRIKKCSILIFSSCLFNVKNEKGDYFNSLHGFYYNLYPNDTLLIEDGDLNNEWRPTGDYNNVSYINTFFLFITSILSKICNRIKKRHNKDYETFSNLLQNKLTTDEISMADYYVSIYSRLINWFIKKVQPKLIIVNCGSYGAQPGIICKIARDNNIKTIDTQHGQIFNHAAYSASSVISSSKEYTSYLPDFLFTFGEYWSNMVEWEYKKVSVGNPYLNKYVSQFAAISDFDKDVLIISQPVFKELQVSFIKELSELLNDKKIVIRLHPAEHIEEQKELYKDCNNITFSDSTVVLYKDMCRSRYVVGWCSTCLFELMAFGRIPFIIDNKISRGHFPEDMGVWFKTPQELSEAIISGTQATTENGGYYWQQGFENNVLNTITNIL